MTQTILRDLGNKLVLRCAGPEDAEALAAFNGMIHNDGRPDPDVYVAAWARDLLTVAHPTFHPQDFTVVEDTHSGKIVSSLNLIPQVWKYAGIPFKVGRPELVGTLPEYRRRGLVSAQFEIIHGWARERGMQVLGITGIPYYYRQFGYEMGMALGGGRMAYEPHVPELPAGQVEPYSIRQARIEDIPFINEIYRFSARRSLVHCVWDEALWLYEMSGKSEKNVTRAVLSIIETPGGERVGLLAHSIVLWSESIGVQLYELKPGASWFEVTPGVMRYLWEAGKAYAIRDQKKHRALYFQLGEDHPAYHAAPERLPRPRRPYTWYLRVPDLPGFLRTIAPVLEQRLLQSVCAGYSGEQKISFYKGGIRMVFEQGRLVLVENALSPAGWPDNQSAFPELTFLQLLFGYRTLAELRYAFADCWVNEDKSEPVLEALFPRQSSFVFPVS